MKILQETTDWEWPNHIYYTTDSKDKMFGYIKASTGEFYEFKDLLPFNTKGRKFKEVANTVGYVEPERKPEGFVKIAIGSKGEKYTITKVDGVLQCSCPGYKFRGKCRHIED